MGGGLKTLMSRLFSRVFELLFTLWVILTLSFFLMKAVPGGPFDMDKAVPPEVKKNIESVYGLDRPLVVQYFSFMKRFCFFDFGPSLRYRGRSVNDIVFSSFSVSASLGGAAFLYVVIVGCVLGLFSGLWHGRWYATVPRAVSFAGLILPGVVLGPVLVLVFCIAAGNTSFLPVLPFGGLGDWRFYILPVVTLGTVYAAALARLIDGAVVSERSSPFILTAMAKGLGSGRAVGRHILLPAMIPALQYMGPLLASLVTGSLVVEQIFQIPGLGRHFVNACLNRDYPLIAGTVFLYSVVLLLCNAVVDVIAALIDPRLKRNEG